jgi:hypothetical protein
MPRADLRVTQVRFRPGKPIDIAQGYLGKATVTFGDSLTVDGVGIRLTRRGLHAVSFPAPKDGDGTRRPVVWPIDAAAHASIERDVIACLREQGHLPAIDQAREAHHG